MSNTSYKHDTDKVKTTPHITVLYSVDSNCFSDNGQAVSQICEVEANLNKKEKFICLCGLVLYIFSSKISWVSHTKVFFKIKNILK